MSSTIKTSPWNVEVVTPSTSLISKFDEFDKTRSTAPKLRSFNRARKWISNLLKRDFKVPEAHKLRNIDSMMALEHMIDSLAMPGGMSYEEYLWSCLAPIQTQSVENSKIEAEDETFQDTTEESIEAVHEGKKPYKCNICDAQFEIETDLKNHLESDHGGKKVFKCYSCDSNFTLETDLHDHIGSVHEGKKPFECDFCDSDFISQADLKNHTRSVHDEKKPLKCNECEAHFEEETHLKHHLESIHLRRNMFKCNTCNVQFTLEEDLKNHIGTFMKERNHSNVVFVLSLLNWKLT